MKTVTIGSQGKNFSYGYGPAQLRHQETGITISWSIGDPPLEPGPGKWDLLGVNLPEIVVRRGTQICFPDAPKISLGGD